MPEEDKTNLRTKDELMAKITVSMGGRAAEEVVMNTMTNGALRIFRRPRASPGTWWPCSA